LDRENDEFSKIWALLTSAYSYWTVKLETEQVQATYRLYKQLLGDLPLEALQTAVIHHVATSKWFPTIAELRSAVTIPESQQLALEAWGDVAETFSSGEYYAGENLIKAPEFRNPLTSAAVRALGGWIRLCQSENEIADRARFVEIYEQLQARGIRDTALTQLFPTVVRQPRLTGAQVAPQQIGVIAAELERRRRAEAVDV